MWWFKHGSNWERKWSSSIGDSAPSKSQCWVWSITTLSFFRVSTKWKHGCVAGRPWQGRKGSSWLGSGVCPDRSPFKNPALCCRPRWGRGGGEERRLWKAIYLLTPYAMFSKLSSLWEEEEDEERPLLVDNLVTKGSCEVICPDCQCSRKAAHGFCH